MFSNILSPKRSLILLLVCLLVACGSESDDEPRPVPSTTGVATLEPVPERRSTLEYQYELLRQSQSEIEQVWRDLQMGRSVACTTVVEMAISSTVITEPILIRAAIETEEAIALWKAECQNPREVIPFEIIDRGLRSALAGGDALRQYRELLDP